MPMGSGETSEDWGGVRVTRKEALRELARHGVAGDDVADFYAACGDREDYDGGAVLRWLGY